MRAGTLGGVSLVLPLGHNSSCLQRSADVLARNLCACDPSAPDRAPPPAGQWQEQLLWAKAAGPEGGQPRAGPGAAASPPGSFW